MLNVYLEKFLPSALAALLVGVLLLNPLRWDWIQRASLLVAIVAVLIFATHTLSINSTAEADSKRSTLPEATSPKEAAPPGDTSTTGANSPAVSGHNNTFIYNQPAQNGRRKKQ
jgi:hypothetical protein